jgi:hypothetical protein
MKGASVRDPRRTSAIKRQGDQDDEACDDHHSTVAAQ